MSEPTGREIARREAAPPGVERFTAPDTAHTVGLTDERAAEIVRQSGNARTLGLAALLFTVIFVPIYWFYDLGFPGVPGSSRLASEAEDQYITDVARGEALFLANCAGCHGPTGKGEASTYGKGGGAPLNDQDKLYQAVTPRGESGPGHLNPLYIEKVLEVGGRYVCGNSASVMPIWSDKNGGPLNYRQIQEIIAFLTASTETSWQSSVSTDVVTVDPVTGAVKIETKQVGTEVHRGWRDPDYKPPAGTVVPACWTATAPPAAGGSPTPGATLPPDVTPGTAEDPRVVRLEANAQLRFVPDTVEVKKGETIRFEITNTAGFPHNFWIGPQAEVEKKNTAALKGTPDFSEGTQALEVTFDGDGPYAFGCFIPGHYEAGMKGTIALVP